jgi:hypothetical protein
MKNKIPRHRPAGKSPGRSAKNKSKGFENFFEIAEKWRFLVIMKRDEADFLYHQANAQVKVNVHLLEGRETQIIRHREWEAWD